MELDALSAITSALEAHSVFEGGGDEDVLPAMLFGLATPLLTNKLKAQQRANQQQQKTNGAAAAALPAAAAAAAPAAAEAAAGAAATPPAAPAKETSTLSKKGEKAKAAALAAPAAEEKVEAEKTARDARQRLAEAFLRLLAERREWVARSLAMAANASPTDLSGGDAAPTPVTINNLLVNSLAHPELLGAFTGRAPVRLRAQAVAAARDCEADGTFARGFGEQLARLLGLGGQREKDRRMAGMAMDKMKTKEASRIAAIKCSRPTCGKRQGNGEDRKFKVCSRCQKAMYCSGVCQALHWKQGHKAECRRT